MIFHAAAPSGSRSAWRETGAQAGREVTILCGSIEGGLRDAVDPRVKVVALDPPMRRGLSVPLPAGAAPWPGSWASCSPT